MCIRREELNATVRVQSSTLRKLKFTMREPTWPAQQSLHTIIWNYTLSRGFWERSSWRRQISVVPCPVSRVPHPDDLRAFSEPAWFPVTGLIGEPVAVTRFKIDNLTLALRTCECPGSLWGVLRASDLSELGDANRRRG